jgi:hypothetical protein
MRRFLTFTIVAATIGLAAAAVWLIAWASPSTAYRHTGTRQDFCRAIRSLDSVHPTVDELTAAVGSGTSVDASDMFRRLATVRPDYFADGVCNGDTYIMYDFLNVTYFFQLREGRLVNHHPEEFGETPSKQTTSVR